MFESAPKSYKDPFWKGLAQSTEADVGLPSGLLQNILLKGERSNADQVSSAGARTPFQIIPQTREAVRKKYGVDAYSSPENAAKAAALLLKESLDRNQGSVMKAVQEYHGGTNPKNYGPINRDYVKRVTGQMEPQESRVDELVRMYNERKKGSQPAGQQTTQQTQAEAPQQSRVDELVALYESRRAKPAPTAPSVQPQAQDRESLIASIPTEPGAVVTPPKKKPEAGIMDYAQAGLGLLSGAVGAPIGMAAGTVGGLVESAMKGQFGTQEGVRTVEQAAQRGVQGLIYKPESQAAQNLMQQAGETMAEILPPVLPMVGQAGVFAQGAKMTAPIVRPAAGQAVAASKQAVQQAKQSAIANQRQSAGAAATPMTQQRIATAEGLPVPMKLTKGAATRDAEQLAFEKEQTKNPSLGQPLRNRIEENNLQALQNFDSVFDAVGAETVSPSATGNKVVDALSAGYKEAKSRTRAAYNRANNSAESQAKVDFSVPVQIAKGEEVVNTDLFTYLNEMPSGLPSNKVADAAKTYAVRLGIATQDAEGNLVPSSPTIKQMESLRSEIQRAVGNEPNDRRLVAEIKTLIDAHTEPVAGPLYQAARAERVRQARKFENRSIVARLISNRRGMDDPKVAVDKVFDNTILKGSPEEITFLKRVLTTSNEDGQQAWKELQGATLNYLKEKSTANNQFDSQGRPIVSSAALNKAIKDLDQNGRLDLVVGKQNAQIMRDLNEVLQYVTTTPPGTLINNSGTAGTIMAAIAEAGATGAVTGLPVPALSVLRQVKSAIDNKRLKTKITNALNAKEKE